MASLLPSFSVIVAATEGDHGIGLSNKIPWKIPQDMELFKKVTTTVVDPKQRSEGARNAVIMGRKTWLSLPEKFRPLKDRINLVVTSDEELLQNPEILTASSLTEALTNLALGPLPVAEIFVIGGARLYAEALLSPLCRKIYFTKISHHFTCDVFLEHFNTENFEIQQEEIIWHSVDPHDDQAENFLVSFILYKRIEKN